MGVPICGMRGHVYPHSHSAVQYNDRAGKMAEAGAVTVEEAEVEYPLRVDYCGLCTLPPEVRRAGRRERWTHRLG